MNPSCAPLYMCVDAGGTKTAAAITDSRGRIVGRGKGGSANMAEIGLEAARVEIIRAITMALSSLRTSAGVNGHSDISLGPDDSRVSMVRAWIGISGCDTEADGRNMKSALEVSLCDVSGTDISLPYILSSQLIVVNDAHLLSSTLLRRKSTWGIAVVAGTGSVILGLRQELTSGSTHCFGVLAGHGHLFGDPGSAYHMGLSAISIATDAKGLGQEREGGLPAVLRKVFKVEDTADIPARAHDIRTDLDPIIASNERKLRIAVLAPLVLAHAPRCSIAAQALKHTTGSLAAYIARMVAHARAAGMSGTGGLIITGGLGVQPEYQTSLVDALEKEKVVFEWIETVSDAAADGAIGMSLAAKNVLT